MKESIRKIIFWAGRILFLLRRLISFALTSRKINKLKKRQSQLRVESIRLRTKKFYPEIADLESRIVEETAKFVKRFGGWKI
jgi:hypothetical protein